MPAIIAAAELIGDGFSSHVSVGLHLSGGKFSAMGRPG